MDLAGIDGDTDGLSIVPLLINGGSTWRSELLLEHYGSAEGAFGVWAGLRTAREKYIEHPLGDKELYDLTTDPFEEENKHGDPAYATLEADLSNRLQPQKGLAMTTFSEQQGIVGVSYAFQLTAWGGQEPYSWSIVDLEPLMWLGSDPWVLDESQLPLQLPGPGSCGPPAVDPGSVAVIALWKDCGPDVWKLRATPGGSDATYAGTITSDQQFISVTPVLLGPEDLLDTSDPTRIDFTIFVESAPNGFDFEFPGGAQVDLDIDTHRLPRGLTLDSASGLISGTPAGEERRVCVINVEGASLARQAGKPQTFSLAFTLAIAPMPVLPTLSLNQSTFRTGETIDLLASSIASSSAAIDMFVLVELPDGAILYLRPDGTLASAVSPFASAWVPETQTGQIFSYTFSGLEPPGTYKWRWYMTEPGTSSALGPAQELSLTFAP